ncbi:hemin ABC transporter substrate-binding protein [Ravibacter arvi]|uniref:Hemin ABC transporter substrate-binding protein n=1 Tax=Ravibacter arvi TaxID=2051041 RepID=A0ABP8LT30_9BACT
MLIAVSTVVPAQRIVSTDGTLSEIICGLGLQPKIVGVDVTSTFPAALKKLRQIGHNRNISAEGVLSLNPDLILVNSKASLNPKLVGQLKQTGKKVAVFDHEYSIEGTKKLIREVGAYFSKEAEAEIMVKKIDRDLAAVKRGRGSKKVLFIYARGAGTLMVSGEATQVDRMIRLSGNKNAATGFKEYKPLTSEAVLAANPDYLLLFEDGLKSLGGVDGLLKVPGVAHTKAGKNRKIIEMDGLFLMGFGPRVGAALAELSEKIR